MKGIVAFSRWFSSSRRQAKRRRRSGARQAAERRSLFLEPLHPRIVLSADYSVDATGLLSVRGDENANTLVIEQMAQNPTGVTVRLTLDGSSPVTVSNVRDIVVEAAGGNDTIRLASRITVGVMLDGGAETASRA